MSTVAELVAEHGSPLWLADVDRFRANLDQFRDAWRMHWPDTRVAYSYKTNRLPAILRVRLGDGSWHEERVLHPRGSPGNPLRDDELMAKFLANAHTRLSEAAARRLATALLDPGRQPVGEILFGGGSC